MKTTVAALRLDAKEVSVVEAALRYYADTWIGDPDEADDEDRAAVATAEQVRLRLRKSIARHGYSLEVL